MQEQRLELYLEGRRNVPPEAIPATLIAQRCNRSIEDTARSLLRLEKRGKVYEPTRGAWLPGERPQKTPPLELVR